MTIVTRLFFIVALLPSWCVIARAELITTAAGQAPVPRNVTATGIGLEVTAIFAVVTDLVTGSLLASELLMFAVPVAASSAGDSSIAVNNSLSVLWNCYGTFDGVSMPGEEADDAASYVVGLRNVLLPARLPAANSAFAGPARDLGGSLVLLIGFAAFHYGAARVAGLLLRRKYRGAGSVPALQRSANLLAPSEFIIAAHATLFPSITIRAYRILRPGLVACTAGLLLTMRKGGNGSHLFVGVVALLIMGVIEFATLRWLRAEAPRLCHFYGYHPVGTLPQAPMRHQDAGIGVIANAEAAGVLVNHSDDVACDRAAAKRHAEQAMTPSGYWILTSSAKRTSLHAFALFEGLVGGQKTWRADRPSATSTARALMWSVASLLRISLIGFTFGAPFVACGNRWLVAAVAHFLYAAIVALAAPYRYPVETWAVFLLSAFNGFINVAVIAPGLPAALFVIAATVTVGVAMLVRWYQFFRELLAWGPAERRLEKARTKVMLSNQFVIQERLTAQYLAQRLRHEGSSDSSGDTDEEELQQRAELAKVDPSSSPAAAGQSLLVPPSLPSVLKRPESVGSEDSDGWSDVVPEEVGDDPTGPPVVLKDPDVDAERLRRERVKGDANPAVIAMWDAKTRVGQPRGLPPSNPLNDHTRHAVESGGARGGATAPVGYPPPRRRFVCYDGADHIYIDDDDDLAKVQAFGQWEPVDLTRLTVNSRMLEALVDGYGAPPERDYGLAQLPLAERWKL